MESWVPFLIGSVLFYGLAQALTKQFMANVSAATFILLYVVDKAVINSAAFAFMGKAPLFDPNAQKFIMIALGGSIVNGFAWLCYYRALECGKVSLVGAVTAAYPALTVLLALAFLGGHLAWYQGLGVALVIGSGVAMALGEAGGDATEHAGGNTWLYYSLGTFLGWGIFTAMINAAFAAPGAENYTFFMWNALGAAIVLGPYGLWALKGQALGTTRDLAFALIPTTLFVLGDLALYQAAGTGPPELVAPLATVYPLITLAYAVPVLKERVAPRQWAAIAMLLVGILATSYPAPAAPVVAAPAPAPTTSP